MKAAGAGSLASLHLGTESAALRLTFPSAEQTQLSTRSHPACPQKCCGASLRLGKTTSSSREMRHLEKKKNKQQRPQELCCFLRLSPCFQGHSLLRPQDQNRARAAGAPMGAGCGQPPRAPRPGQRRLRALLGTREKEQGLLAWGQYLPEMQLVKRLAGGETDRSLDKDVKRNRG